MAVEVMDQEGDGRRAKNGLEGGANLLGRQTQAVEDEYAFQNSELQWSQGAA